MTTRPSLLVLGRRAAASLAFSTLLFGCGPQPSPELETEAPVLGAVSESLPPGMVRIYLSGPHTAGGVRDEVCHAVLISAYRLVTSAHCFAGFGPTQVQMFRIFNMDLTAANVRFHPNAWADGQTAWSSVRDESTLTSVFDLAIITLPQSPYGITPVKLWNPPNATSLDLSGRTLTFGGAHVSGGGATGREAIRRLEARDGGHFIIGDRSPSGLLPGDSGGGATIMLTSDLPLSQRFGTPLHCPPPAAAHGERVLVGINTAYVGNEDFFVATFTDAIAGWLAESAFDPDSDGVCSYDDNCPNVSNADQRNCNAFAEQDPRWLTSGESFGDACDPVPCPHASAWVTEHEPGPSSYSDAFTSYGRVISDVLGLEPVIALGDSTQVSSTIYFCVCRNPDGTPVSDPTVCEGAPHWCIRDPLVMGSGLTEVGHGMAPGPGETYWKRITVSPAGPARGAVTLQYPSPIQFYTWNYVADYQDWLGRGLITPLPVDPKFGPGTDLAGVIWVRSNTQTGASVHDLPDTSCGITPEIDNCSISDHFAEGIAPDAKTIWRHYPRVPRWRPNPFWTFCAMCGVQSHLFGDIVSNPARILTFDDDLRATRWTERGGVDVTTQLTEELRTAMVRSSVLWLGSSEPAALLESRNSRAVMLASDGTRILGTVTEGSGRFGFSSTYSAARGMSPRTGFAAAYARSTGATYVAGGTSSGIVQGDVYTHRAGVWSRVRLADPGQAPVAARSSAYSVRDERLWVIDQVPRAGLVLRRIDPARGAASSYSGLSVLSGLTEVWATALGDGRILVAGNHARGHRLAVLDVERTRLGERVVVVGSVERAGVLGMAPAVAATEVTVAVVETVGAEVVLRPEVVALRGLGVR